MSWQNAKKVADDWIAKNLAPDLRAKLVQLVAFNSDEDCRFFYPDRDLGFHKMVTTAIARTARKRGAKTIYVPTTPKDLPAGADPREFVASQRSHDRDDNTQTPKKNRHPMDRASAPHQNKFHVGNGEDGKHYWLTPPELRAELQAEFQFDFDACPYPKPADFDGLTCEWGASTYANIPFGSVIGHDGKKKGPTAWARKAIAESKKGKRVVLLYPIDKWILMMLASGAQVRNLGDVRWCATEDGSQGKGTGRHIAAFILEGAVASQPTTLAAEERATPTPSTHRVMPSRARRLSRHIRSWR